MITFSDFNPRTHEECDKVIVCFNKHKHNFNPRTHEECDGGMLMQSVTSVIFQSTHSRGVRRWKVDNTDFEGDFNPRTHEECDDIFIRSTLLIAIFQSTHSRGVRLIDGKSMPVLLVFQSTHSRGVRLKVYNGWVLTVGISIHALTRSATLYHPLLHHRLHHFNPRTHEECDSLSL